LTLTLLSAVGALHIIGGSRAQSLGWLFIIGAVIPILVLASGKAQVFDNDRLLMPSFPFLAALAGIGFAIAVRSIRYITLRTNRSVWAAPLIGLLAGTAFIPQCVRAYELYPHLLSYYSEGIGGLRGAARLGLEHTYWAETYDSALAYINTHARPRAMVWVEAHDVMLYYQRHGQLRSDLRVVSPHGNEGIVEGVQGYTAPIANADYAIIQYRETGLTGEMTRWMRGRIPVYRLAYEHVPLMEVYER
jgi:hypothetical protein